MHLQYKEKDLKLKVILNMKFNIYEAFKVIENSVHPDEVPHYCVCRHASRIQSIFGTLTELQMSK